jgi:PBP1b-binding outer membrane lipoprotein LpoB
MRKYISFLATTLAIFLFSGCLSNKPKFEKDDNVIERTESEPKSSKESVEMPPESNLIDKIIENEVIIEDTPTKETKQQIIESVD